jgi:endonuclease/exonuclease/phosphatase (EEP) superfamily protein YafD
LPSDPKPGSHFAKQPPLALRLARDIAMSVFVVSTLGACGRWFYLFDLCSHFRGQYLALLAVLAAILWRMNARAWAGVAVLGAIHNAVLVVPYYLASPGAPPVAETRPALSLVSFNVHTANRKSADVLDYLTRRDPDLILLIEVDHRWIRELAPLEQRYPYSATSPQADNFGMAVYSKVPILDREIAPLAAEQPACIWLELELDGKRFGFLGAHPWPPMTPALFRSRNAQLESIAERVRASALPMIVAGDFNATPWCSGFRPLIAAGLHDTARGFGLQRTWNSKIPLLRIPIDHVLTTPDFVCRRRAVGPSCGSDHYAVEAELAIE